MTVCSFLQSSVETLSIILYVPIAAVDVRCWHLLLMSRYVVTISSINITIEWFSDVMHPWNIWTLHLYPFFSQYIKLEINEKRLWTEIVTAARFLIRFMSGLWFGCSNLWLCFDLNHSSVGSCWKVDHHPTLNPLAAFYIFFLGRRFPSGSFDGWSTTWKPNEIHWGLWL